MADVGVLRSLLILLSLTLKDVTSNIDDGGIESSYQRFNEFYEPLEEKLSSAVSLLAQPFENSLWRGPKGLGQISGVAVDLYGNPVVFHRGDRIWDYNTFNETAEYQEGYRGPIAENTVLTLDPEIGDIIRGWGNHTFYMPHGITIDSHGNVWLTDVAMHQVFKYSSSGVPELTLGQKFIPGSDLRHFCQPTSVAVASTGEIVVADGYCNSRLLLFDPMGNPKYSVGTLQVYLSIPHSLTILPNNDVCVADRENARVVCLDVGLPRSEETTILPYVIRHRQFHRVFAVTSYRGIIYAVNGPMSLRMQPKGFIISPEIRDVIGFWGPESGYFTQPHAVAVCPNGTTLYVAEIGPNRVWKFDIVKVDPSLQNSISSL